MPHKNRQTPQILIEYSIWGEYIVKWPISPLTHPHIRSLVGLLAPAAAFRCAEAQIGDTLDEFYFHSCYAQLLNTPFIFASWKIRGHVKTKTAPNTCRKQNNTTK